MQKKLIKQVIFILLLFFFKESGAQNNQVIIDKVQGNSKVTLIQGNKVQVTYDLNNSAHVEAFIQKLSSLSEIIKKFFSELMSTQKTQFSKTDKAIKAIPKKVIDQILSNSDARSILALEIEIRQLRESRDRAIEDLEKYKKENPSLIQIIEEAQKKIEVYDLSGFNEIITNWGMNSIKNVSKGFFLNATIFEAFGYYDSAFQKMKIAHYYDSSNVDYIMGCLRIARRESKIQEVLYFFRKAKEHEILSYYDVLDIYRNVGYAYLNISNADSALFYFEIAINILEKEVAQRDSVDMFLPLFLSSGISKAYMLKKNYVQAEKWLKMMKDMLIEKKISSDSANSTIALVNKRIAEAYYLGKFFDSTILYMQKAIKILMNSDTIIS